MSFCFNKQDMMLNYRVGICSGCCTYGCWLCACSSGHSEWRTSIVKCVGKVHMSMSSNPVVKAYMNVTMEMYETMTLLISERRWTEQTLSPRVLHTIVNHFHCFDDCDELLDVCTGPCISSECRDVITNMKYPLTFCLALVPAPTTMTSLLLEPSHGNIIATCQLS